MSFNSRTRSSYHLEEVLELLATEDDFDWNDSEASDAPEDEIDYQPVWEPHNRLDIAEEQAHFDEQYARSSSTGLHVHEEFEESCEEQVI